MIANEHLERVLPLTVSIEPFSESRHGFIMWEVRTNGGFRVGSRLLKGACPPDIRDFGPFKERKDADCLVDRLTRHIENDWPKRKKRR